jgi:hypothetical protein
MECNHYPVLTIYISFCQGLTFWDDTEIDDFKFILEGAAELSSCDLAVVCNKPCREVRTFVSWC